MSNKNLLTLPRTVTLAFSCGLKNCVCCFLKTFLKTFQKIFLATVVPSITSNTLISIAKAIRKTELVERRVRADRCEVSVKLLFNHQ